MTQEKIALFAGSFDPFTRGHEALVQMSLRLFDRVVIGIGDNIAKRSLLKAETRKRLIEQCFLREPRVSVAIYQGLTGDFAREVGASVLVRGVRNTLDFEYERTMEAANRRIYPDLTTLLLFTPAEVADIASSTVRELAAFGRSVDEFLPEGIRLADYLE